MHRTPSPKIKILHILGSLARGGAESRTVEILRHLDHDRYEFHFATNKQGCFCKEIESLGGTVHYRPLKKLSPVYYSYFKNLLIRERFDVVHSHVHYASGYYLRLAKKTGIPIRIAHFRSANNGNVDNLLRRPYVYLMRRWINKFATHLLSVSNIAMDVCWPLAKDSRCQTIYNGLDLNAYRDLLPRNKSREKLGYTEEDKVIIHVGRHVAVKNYPKVLEVFAKTLSTLPKAKLLLVGIGEDSVEREISQRIDQLGIASAVQRTGLRTDVPNLIGAADMMLFPSFSEGLPGAVLEASALGIPVLGSDIPGTQEIATYFSTIKCLSLEQSDSHWVAAVQELLKKHEPKNSDWHKSINQYEKTPFTIAKCMKHLYKIWNSTSPISPHSFQSERNIPEPSQRRA